MNKIQKKAFCVITSLVMAVSMVPAAMMPAKNVDAKTVKLAAPKSVSAKTKGSDSVKVSWAKVSKAEKYKVYRATKKKGTYTLAATTTKLTKTIKKLKANKTYYFKVATYAKKYGTGKYSAVVKAKTNKDTVKTLSFKLKQSGKHEILVTWKKVEGVDGYQVANRVSTKKNATIRMKNGTKNTTSFLSNGKTIGKTYYFKMRTFKLDKKGKRVYSKWTKEKSIKMVKTTATK
ncbi:MAG: fibronectin type III domain-containing protein [Anaerostipes sp.]|nr:fibronectin type III domain-containing protein [Anaerostipes sp.]